MLLTKGIIKADLIAARQAIEYFQNKRNLLNTRYTRVCLM